MARHNAYLTGFWVICMLLTGTLNTLTTKIQFTMISVGIDGEKKVFEKPWYGTLNMLTAMFLVLVAQQMFNGCELIRNFNLNSKIDPLLQDASSGTASEGQKPSKTWGQKVLLVAVPAGLDLLATAACCIGIMFIPASVWQMLRGAALIFSALQSVFFLKRKLYAYNWLGLFICVVGITAVGVASVYGTSGDSKDSGSDADVASVVYGITLVLFGQIFQAAQVVAEEWLMKDVDLPVFQIIGFEGFWGMMMMFFVVYPILWILPGKDGGHMEDPFDTVVMISNCPALMACVVTYLFSCGTFNITGIQVTAALSAVHRMMIDASRTMVIWAFGLFVHYRINPDSKFGEKWNKYSYVQLVGFLVLTIGQAIYGEVLKVPCFKYPSGKNDLSKFASPAAMTNLASPLPREA